MKNLLSIRILPALVALVFVAQPATAQVLATSDGVIRFSLCVGGDCPNNPSFGADTIRLQENNLRIHFDDTSTSGSFPRNDWRLVANETSNGGLSFFGIEDSTAGNFPFRVEAGAGANALYVDDGGRVGLGTNTPVVELHVRDGDTPTLRLEQDQSSGFAAQTWDLAGNETNFFVRDVNNGSLLPFKIRPGAATNSLTIQPSGDVSIGANSVGTLRDGRDAALYVVRSDGEASILVAETSGTQGFRTLFEITNNGSVGFEMRNTAAGGTSWQMSSSGDGDFEFNDIGGGDGAEFQISTTGNVTVAGDLTTGGTGACSSGCDIVFDPGYGLESIEEHATQMWKNRHLPAVGPTPENAPRFNVTKKVGGILNELEKAHIYIERLNETVKAKDEQIAALAERLERLEQRMAAPE